MRSLALLSLALAVALPLAACGGDAPSAAAKDQPPTRFLLPGDPGTAIDVKSAVAAAPKDGEVVVVGRVGRFVEGLAAFTLVDDSLAYCGRAEKTMDGCETPWDYCCVTDQLPGAQLHVEVRTGKDAVAVPRIPELRLLDLVAVKGRLVKEAGADPILVASGWWRRERPTLGDHVKFP